ncbi:hypothetical protein [Adhaeribacter terreus]|uniref:MORN repeat variant n=1 Tax=Adhaeribacter terreus TaxID=529703 RepID=A0ABW0EFK3_9BACT
MKQIIILFSIFFISIQLYGQETIFFVQKKPNGQIEEFYVLKSDKNTKHGTYVKYRMAFGNVIILESGNFNNGQKHGDWQSFYDSNKYKNSLKERGTYFNGSRNGLWSTFYMDTTSNFTGIEKYGKKKTADSLAVNIEQKALKIKQAGIFIKDKRVGEWVTYNFNGELIQKYNFNTIELFYDREIKDSLEYNKTRKATFLGGKKFLIDYLNENITRGLPLLNRNNIHFKVSFTIDENGKITDLKVIDSNLLDKTNSNLLSVFYNLDSSWIVALDNGNKVKYTYQAEWKVSKEKTTHMAYHYKDWKVAFTLSD